MYILCILWICSFSNLYCHFTYVTTHSPTLPSLYLRHSSFSNPSVASPTSRFILQLFFRFSYVTSSALNSPGEPPMFYSQVICNLNFKICKRSFKNHHHQSVLPKGRSFTANAGTKAAVRPNGRSFTANSGTKAAVLLGMYRWCRFPLLSAPHSLFSIWTDFKRSEKIQGTRTWKWGEWIWLTGPYGLHWNSAQRLNIVPSGFLTRSEIRIHWIFINK